MKYRFSGHQTFVFRYGWLEKGVRSVAASHGIFSAEDAIVRLGVGKNMVESIRHWCFATQMLEEQPDPADNKGHVIRPSNLAKQLLLKNGWDPFLENDASLWLVHWLLVSNPHIGTSWQLAFGHFHRPDFSKRELVDFVKSFAEKQSIRVSESSLARDIDCLLRTYLPVRNGARAEIAEETFDCPLQELGLLQASPDGEFFRFAIGCKRRLKSAAGGARKVRHLLGEGNGFWPSRSSPVALPVGFQDVHPVRQAVQQRAGQPLAAQHFGPLGKGQVGRHQQAGALIRPAHYLEEQLRPGFGERHIAQLIQQEQVQPLSCLCSRCSVRVSRASSSCVTSPVVVIKRTRLPCVELTRFDGHLGEAGRMGVV